MIEKKEFGGTNGENLKVYIHENVDYIFIHVDIHKNVKSTWNENVVYIQNHLFEIKFNEYTHFC